MKQSSLDRWLDADSEIGIAARKNNQEHLETYRSSPTRVDEDVANEKSIYQGGYTNRQIFELVQNAADAARLAGVSGRIELRLTDDGFLYCGNTGEPLTVAGLTALQFTRLSPKVNKDIDLIGRFGVGFKSMLSVTGSLQVFSRSGSVSFDREASEKLVRQVVPDCVDTPGMRFAIPFDPQEDFKNDFHIAEMADWAHTVIRAKIGRENREAISYLLKTFPQEFLLFVKHVKSISIKTHDATREITKRERGGVVTLSDTKKLNGVRIGEKVSRRWRIFESSFEASSEAKQDAPTGFNDDLPIPISWAVPLDGLTHGRIWSFFPTDVETSLSGILNAPWRTSEDRTSVARGEYNREIISYTAALIAESLPEVVGDLSSPGLIVDILNDPDPENQIGWVEEDLAEAVYEECSLVAAFADGSGKFCTPDELRVWGPEYFHRSAKPPHERTGELWAKGPKVPEGWAHWTFFRSYRAKRLRALKTNPNNSLREAKSDYEWFSDLVEQGNPMSSVHAIKVLDDYERRDEDGRLRRKPEETSVRQAEIILMRDGSFDSVDNVENLLLEGPVKDKSLDGSVVHPLIVADEKCRKYLEYLGVRKDIGVIDRVELFIQTRHGSDNFWPELWKIINSASLGDVAETLKKQLGNEIHVRCMNGEYNRISEVLWPGEIVPEDGSGGKAATIDQKFHRKDRAILMESFYASSKPRLLELDTFKGEKWKSGYGVSGKQSFCWETGKNPHWDKLQQRYPKRFIHPLGVLEHLEPESAERFVRMAIEVNPDPGRGDVVHTTQKNKYPTVKTDPPEVYMFANYGFFATSKGISPASEAIRNPSHSSEGWPIPPQLSNYLPIVDISILEPTFDKHSDLADYHYFGLNKTEMESTDFHRTLHKGIPEKHMSSMITLAYRHELLGLSSEESFWEIWDLPIFGYRGESLVIGKEEIYYSQVDSCFCGAWDYDIGSVGGDLCETCNTQVQPRHTTNVGNVKMRVTAFPELNPARGIDNEETLVLSLRDRHLVDWLDYPDGEVFSLDKKRIFANPHDSIHEDVEVEIVATNQSETVRLKDLLNPAGINDFSTDQIMFCDSLELLITQGDLAATRECLVFRDGQTWYIHVDHSRLEELIEDFAYELWATKGIIAESETLQDLLLNTWESEELRRRKEIAISKGTNEEKLVALLCREDLIIDEGISGIIPETQEGNEISDYELGRILISKYGIASLKANSHLLPNDAPQRFFGNPKARTFVQSVELDTVFAGMGTDERPETESVEGPTILPKLHSYQTQIVNRIGDLVSFRENKNRGLISLPTGAGKTRVAVEGLIKASDDQAIWPVLWVAQSDELCEQAADTWRNIWRAIGSPNEQLSISRLWGNNEFNLENEGPQVVIATNQKMHSIESRKSEEINLSPGVVVIDEAHHSTAPTYTKIINKFISDTDVTLIGLTATPFRGTNSSTTKWLSNRFSKNRLDRGILGSDPVRTLRDDGILAYAEHRLIETNTSLALESKDLQHWETFKTLPTTIEERLAMDPDRTKLIVETAMALPKDWQIILYCPSVTGAEFVAAHLSLAGVNAQSLSSRTPWDARRKAIRDYNDGKIRILTNYTVLAEGFDAPSTRAIIISRPIFSPNLYQQIVGRGLRGPKNGGKENCTIIDVADNYDQFGGKLAFTHFEYLWSE